MNERPCEVCGKPGLVQGAPGAPYSGCWCPDHAPRPASPLYMITKTILILAILALAAYKISRRLSG